MFNFFREIHKVAISTSMLTAVINVLKWSLNGNNK